MNKNKISEAAKRHAIQILGEEQASKNKNAVKSICADFIAGVNYAINGQDKGSTFKPESFIPEGFSRLSASDNSISQQKQQ